MAIYVFSSDNLTNIWAGIGAGLWAVSKPKDPSVHQGRVTKAEKIKIGSLGVLYCNAIHALTTPLVVYSTPEPNVTIKNIWPEPWVLPFKIHPLGTPNKKIGKDEAMEALPTLRALAHRNFGHALPVQGNLAFVPSKLVDQDWEVLISRLAEGAIVPTTAEADVAA